MMRHAFISAGTLPIQLNLQSPSSACITFGRSLPSFRLQRVALSSKPPFELVVLAEIIGLAVVCCSKLAGYSSRRDSGVWFIKSRLYLRCWGNPCYLVFHSQKSYSASSSVGDRVATIRNHRKDGDEL